jgi:hypothetical protein
MAARPPNRPFRVTRRSAAEISTAPSPYDPGLRQLGAKLLALLARRNPRAKGAIVVACAQKPPASA